MGLEQRCRYVAGGGRGGQAVEEDVQGRRYLCESVMHDEAGSSLFSSMVVVEPWFVEERRGGWIWWFSGEK